MEEFNSFSHVLEDQVEKVSQGAKENACCRSFWGIKNNQEKDAQWHLRKLESNDERVTAAEQTDGHCISVVRFSLPAEVFSHVWQQLPIVDTRVD